MQYPVIVLSFLSSFALSAPTISSRQAPSTDAISTAANAWAADTGVVSQFLSAAGTLSGTALTSSAQNALEHELDELNQKAVLDAEFGPGGPMANGLVVGANNTLVTQGTFNIVVVGLQGLADNGNIMTPDEVNIAVLGINMDRCVKVLPAIDVYLGAASQFLDNGLTLVANRPNNCPSSASA